MNCDEAIRLILDSVESQNEQQTNLAFTYIRYHPNCLARMDQFTRAILSDLDQELTCAESRQALFAYYELETRDGDAARTLPDLHNHLQRCPYCQLDYQSISQSIQSYVQNPPLLAGPRPTFDLTFLPPLPAPPLWDIQDQIRTFAEEISILLAQFTASFGALSAGLTPALSSAVPLRAEGQSASYAALILPDAEANIRFQIEVATIDQTTARVILHVFDATTHKTVLGARVTLRTAQRTLMSSLLTESDGQASFPGLGEGKYLFQIRYQDATWELPVVIISSPQSPIRSPESGGSELQSTDYAETTTTPP